MHILKKKKYINSTASNLLILDSETEKNEWYANSIFEYIVETYKNFAANYYNESQDIFEKFVAISFWKASSNNRHNCYNILHLIKQKYMCINLSERVSESSFRKSNLCKSSLINMFGPSILDVMFILVNQKLSFEYIINKIGF